MHPTTSPFHITGFTLPSRYDLTCPPSVATKVLSSTSSEVAPLLPPPQAHLLHPIAHPSTSSPHPFQTSLVPLSPHTSPLMNPPPTASLRFALASPALPAASSPSPSIPSTCRLLPSSAWGSPSGPGPTGLAGAPKKKNLPPTSPQASNPAQHPPRLKPTPPPPPSTTRLPSLHPGYRALR